MNPRHWPVPGTPLPIYVYAYLDAEGDILYIGQSYDLPTRHGAHRQRSPWFSLATDRAIVGIYYRRRDSLDAEREAIELHRPRFNVMHNPDRLVSA